MNMIEVKTAELEGAALDWAVAMTGAVTVEQNGLDLDARGRPTVGGDMKIPYEPSKNWAQCGPLIEKYKLDIGAPLESKDGPWVANTEWGHPLGHKAPTPLIAACRAIVAAKLGDTVSVPRELVA